jgi:hypothetical protein
VSNEIDKGGHFAAWEEPQIFSDTISEVEGSHVIMVSQPQTVTDVILTAVAAVG